jgi:hypothetical protein
MFDEEFVPNWTTVPSDSPEVGTPPFQFPEVDQVPPAPPIHVWVLASAVTAPLSELSAKTMLTTSRRLRRRRVLAGGWPRRTARYSHPTAGDSKRVREDSNL